jgi:hypothetical protein
MSVPFLSASAILAVAREQAERPSPAKQAVHTWVQLHLPTHWPGQTDLLQWCHTMGPGEAALMILAGVVYLLWGLEIYKFLVILNAALLGAFLGAIVGTKVGEEIVAAAIGAFMAGAVAWSLMKYAVSLMGGIFGALAGASLWRAFSLPPELSWAGAMSGLILFGLMSFIVFNGSVMTYMSLQGAVMLLMGVLGLASKYQDLMPKLSQWFSKQPLLLPVAIGVPMVIGLIYQQTNGVPALAAGASKKK